jgi:guanylate kinase
VTFVIFNGGKIMKDTIFVILGKAASGKSDICKDISKIFGIEEVVTATSRPPRPGEIDGVHYHFKKKDEFNKNDFIEIKEFNNWKYGTPNNSIQEGKKYVIVLEPQGYRNFKEKFGDRVIGVYIMAPQADRFYRYVKRDGNAIEAHRRFSADNVDFEGIEYEVEHIVINNKTYQDALKKVKKIIVEESVVW